MVVKLCAISSVLTRKILFIVVGLVTIMSLLYILQIQKLFVNVEVNNYSEPIDVVYTWVNGSDPRFLQNLQDYLQTESANKVDYSNQRFDDKYELKFSLRSLEKHAPWIRHVYIVTNGQIPYWLDLDYEKVSLVSHEDIFLDKYDLPTFSSPAIESHLHRIPGLSNRFIYFNDDVFLGTPAYLDDFVTSSKGYLIYLAWPLPMCAVDCPWVYVADGQCDTACYKKECQMDGGDCDEPRKGFGSWNDDFIPDLYAHDSDLDYVRTELRKKPKLSERKVQHDGMFNYIQKLQDKITHHLNKNVTENVTKSVAATLLDKDNRVLVENLNKTDNITGVVTAYNNKIMFFDKINRKKLKRIQKKYKRAAGTLGNSSLVYKLRGINHIDAYGASLQHTNRLLNLKYGFLTRQAPAHSPVLIDKEIMESLQQKFENDFKKTSRNRIRREDDVQFTFSYDYFIIHEKCEISAGEIFDKFDTDASGTWSDREIRTLLTKLYELPLSYSIVDHFEELVLNCSKITQYQDVNTPEFERYLDSKLPTVTKTLVVNCPVLADILQQNFGQKQRYKYEIIKNAHGKYVTFKMLNSNISEVVGHLDEIRRHTKKFVCLNDNMEEAASSENELVRAVLYDFYLSLFPTPSKFELPTDFRNRFLYFDELNHWKRYHFKLKLCVYICVLILFYVTYFNICKRRLLYRFVNKIFC